jgi:hypothetical protein
LADVVDPHGQGLVFQPFRKVHATIMAIGRRACAGGVHIGILHVLQERFFRDAILQAAETIDSPEVLHASLEVLDALDHRGYFTLNWIQTDHGLRLTSMRPTPRAIFRSFLCGGVDVLSAACAIRIVPPGIRLIAAPTYLSFERPSA